MSATRGATGGALRKKLVLNQHKLGPARALTPQRCAFAVGGAGRREFVLIQHKARVAP
jgi:hypothetical protein